MAIHRRALSAQMAHRRGQAGGGFGKDRLGRDVQGHHFGNTRDHKYTRYALVQSAHYQNIPRSIQNVFLNTKLDADFVKTTIIQSMTDEDLPIDLQTYRRLVTDFEREYDEIDCWFRQTRDGNYPVRQQALKIAEQGRKIVALDNNCWTYGTG